MYSKEEEKQKILGMLRLSSQGEMQFTKQQNFQRAIEFAVDELNELEYAFEKFISEVSHLEVFQTSLKEPLTNDVSKHLQNLKYLIQRNYTDEEKNKMPQEVLNQVRATQQRRVEILQQVARRYLSKPRTD
jgi:hypothetical protein